MINREIDGFINIKLLLIFASLSAISTACDAGSTHTSHNTITNVPLYTQIVACKKEKVDPSFLEPCLPSDPPLSGINIRLTYQDGSKEIQPINGSLNFTTPLVMAWQADLNSPILLQCRVVAAAFLEQNTPNLIQYHIQAEGCP